MNRVFGLDMDTWSALSAIGSLIGAIGTVTAVWIALRLATRDYDPHLTVVSFIANPKAERPEGPSQEVIVVLATNSGHTPITITGVFWSVGWWRRKMFPLAGLADWPREITHSQQVSVRQNVAEFELLAIRLAEFVDDRWYGGFLLRSIRCGFYTSSGKFSKRANAQILDRIRKVLAEKQLTATSRK